MSSWRRLTQPANVIRRKCSGAVLIVPHPTLSDVASDRPTYRRPPCVKIPRSRAVVADRVLAPDGLTRSPMSRAEQDRARSSNTWKAAAAGALGGGAVAGPVGAVVGGLVGALFGNGRKLE